MTTTVACLLGPTAAGKTAAALAFAERMAARGRIVEIVSMDSALVYRGMDIGTAKPGAAERAIVAHHLIDLIEPAHAWSAAQFRVEALRALAQILERHHVPLLVGGTMLYYRALTQGLSVLPHASPTVRASLDAEAAREGWPALHARLARIDPLTAARLAPNDAQRIQRALEVFILTGQPLSAWLAAPPAACDETAAYRFAPVALEPSDRSALHERIARRFDTMLARGFIAEVKALRARGDLHAGLPSMHCVGYRQAWEYLDGAIDYDTMRDRAIFATRQLCKRQLTWLRSMPQRKVIDCCAQDAVARAVQMLERIE